MSVGRPKGYQKTGGRQRGTPNKSSIPIEQLCADKQCSPFEILIELALNGEPGMRFQAAKELAQYLMPKKRAIEIDAGIDLELAKSAETFAAMSKEDQIELMERELKRLKD